MVLYEATYKCEVNNETRCLYFVINNGVDEKWVQCNETKRKSEKPKKILAAQIFPTESLTQLCNISKLKVGNIYGLYTK
jgi:hypothetical protein